MSRWPLTISPITTGCSSRVRADLPGSCPASAGVHDEHDADAHVERPPHVLVRNVAGALQPLKDRRHGPRRAIDARRRTFRQNPRQVVGDPAAGDVRHPLDRALARPADRPRADRSGAASAAPANRLAQFVDLRVDCETEMLEDDTARQRVAVACAGHVDGSPISTSPIAMLRPSTSVSPSTAPTMNPARSYSPSA